MKNGDKKKVIYHQILGGKEIKVEVEATMYWHDGNWEECFDHIACKKIDAEIERVLPGWFHTCNGQKEYKKDCPACQRKQLDKEQLSVKVLT